VTLPPNNPYVQLLAGRRRGVLITLVFDTSKCEGVEAERLHNVSVKFVASIIAVQRPDGKYWYKVVVPLKIARMLVPLKGCVKAQVFIEPWLTTRKATRATTESGTQILPKQIRSRNKLLAFKTKYMAVVVDLGRELKSKYPDKAERVDVVINTLVEKLKRMRAVEVSDYIFTLVVASKEFPELGKALPTREEVEEVLEEWRSCRT
jgi:hypothetical protein